MYGIRAALLVASRAEKDPKNYIPIRQISDRLEVSFHYLTKILQILTRAEIMESYKGPNGGVRLGRPADQIFLKDIIDVLDGEEVFGKCILGLPECLDENPCPLHEKCGQAMGQLRQMFKTTNLAKLVEDSDFTNFSL